ncbi:hypothetical protein B738_21183 [Photorhabdus temperata subsp. temperata M1021]|nr:hypothetical protein B738_21183 [Photorhabdus temperata subsp. temperata M1021]
MFFLLAVVICTIIGNYSGGALYLYLSSVPVSHVTWWTLYNGVHLPFKHPDFASAIWGSVLTAWIMFLPVLVVIIVLWLHFMPKSSLYGNARFANDRELEPFHYKGEYN